MIDIDGFDDKHQHVLVPTSLITGTIGLVAEKARDHVLSKKKDAMVGATAAVINTDSATDATTSAIESPNEYPTPSTSKRPTIIDFMAKFKTKRSIDSGKDDWGCSTKFSIADGIGEHTVDTNERTANVEITPVHELEEAIMEQGPSNAFQSRMERLKRSNDDNDKSRNPSSPFCSASSFCSAISRKQPQSKCSTGTCDRIQS